MTTTVSQYVTALLSRDNAVIKRESDPVVVEIEKRAGVLQTLTRFTVYEDGRISVAMKDLDEDDAEPEVHSQYLVQNTKINQDGSFQVLRQGW